jgi:flagellar basal body-associated protein FliL
MQEQEQAKPKGIIPPFIGSIGRVLQKGLRSIGIVLAAILVLMMVCINLWIAYIMFAPDTMPKPFYLSYQTEPGQANQSAEQSKTNAQQSGEKSNTTAPIQAPIPKAPSVPLEIKAGQGIMFDTGTKIVNLADPSGRRYIKTNIILEYAPNDITYFLENKDQTPASGGEQPKAGAAAAPVMTYADRFKQELEPKRPLIDDTIITLLSSKNFDQVYSAGGKEELRKEIMAMLNSRMPEYRIIFVYFTEFTVQ